ncbi:histidine-rich glycoprotein-like [Lacerta agilis]|uniref:histidine-rich glycoprotein-like n=1 Tax=Lacerta agilis TaxID=80427 RepID=UPI00141A5749|nr:histidine-rich glycoprotein-like [Lacerta agilis]
MSSSGEPAFPLSHRHLGDFALLRSRNTEKHHFCSTTGAYSHHTFDNQTAKQHSENHANHVSLHHIQNHCVNSDGNHQHAKDHCNSLHNLHTTHPYASSQNPNHRNPLHHNRIHCA